jgi:hypothetical protein
MGCVKRYAQNSFSSLSTPSLDRLLELSPRAPFLSPRSHQPALRFCLIHHHSGTSGLEGPDPDKHLAHILSPIWPLFKDPVPVSVIVSSVIGRERGYGRRVLRCRMKYT